jgi:hypothetical protein
LKVLALSTTSFRLTQSWMNFVQLFIFVILKSYFILFSRLIITTAIFTRTTRLCGMRVGEGNAMLPVSGNCTVREAVCLMCTASQ